MNRARTVPTYAAPWSLFLDVDGTLLDFADHPDSVRPRPGTRALLARLRTLADGALALISGRAIATIDHLFAPPPLPCAGLHGLERRDASGCIQRQPLPLDRLAFFRERLARFAAVHPGALLEDKGGSLALHYRRCPEVAEPARLFLEKLMAGYGGGGELLLMRGKMVLEVRPAVADKGTAIEAFMAEDPFSGRIPVFIGDDATDEHGFAVVNALDGHSIKVGAGTSVARARLPDIDAVLLWLQGYANYLETRR